MNHARVTLQLICCCALLVPQTSIASEFRIWVNLYGRFSVEATAEAVDGKNVVLRRKDGGEVTVAIDQLSDEDQSFLEDLAQRKEAANNPLRATPPERRQFEPLPELDLPPAEQALADYQSLELLPAAEVAIPDSEPAELDADPSPVFTALHKSSVRIYGVDVYDDCSRPIPITTVSDSGEHTTSIVMSITRGTSSPG